ncbi:MAG: hypothetical protein RMK19_01670 [Bacteroidia bacterium]|nr:hypothetical protein [Bacteroidia bacterium]MDW8014701.1 hypothetical protein [Bacteroidia bacterium]
MEVFLRWVFFLAISSALGQRLLIGPTGRDTVLPAGRLVIRYIAPEQWRQDTFILIVRNALGVVNRGRLFPQKGLPHQTEISIPRAGFYLFLVQHPRTPARLWSSARVYLLAPPHTSVAQVRAYHNALLAKKPSSSPPLPAELLPLSEPFPNVPPLPSVDITEEEILPEEELLPSGGDAEEELSGTFLEEDSLTDE